ncbi:MAG: hypothetical protein LUG14_11745 [Synergistaceae bacterium]|nr:hypothetical protein [Synergistaceae bacterium]
MGRRRGFLLAEAVAALFFALSFFLAVTSMLAMAAKLASRGILSIEAERRAEEFIAVLASGGADELAEFEVARRVIPGGVAVRRYRLPAGEGRWVSVVWPEKR